MDRIFLQKGAHESLEQGGCVMEFAAWVAGEPHSDRPKCVPDDLGAYARRLNDWLRDDERQRLIPFAIEAIGAAKDADSVRRRMFLCADAAVRIFLPLALDRRDPRRAASLRALPVIVDKATAQQGLAAAAAAAAYAYAAYAAAAAAAADAAAADAAAYAAYAYAAAAADDAAAAAAAFSAAAAACSSTAFCAAAYAATTAAAAYATASYAADATTCERVVSAALSLFGRLCAVGRAEVPVIADRAQVVRASCSV